MDRVRKHAETALAQSKKDKHCMFSLVYGQHCIFRFVIFNLEDLQNP